MGNKHHYINAGITLLNLRRMRGTTSIQHILNAISELKDEIILQDQDILNVLYKDDIKYESKYFNCLAAYIKSIDTEELDKFYFIHYNGTEKPWKITSHNALANHWWDLEKERGNAIKYYSYICVRKVYMLIRNLYLKLK